MDLRPYQDTCIADAREQLRIGKKRVLITMPTGGGKTVVAAAIIKAAVEKAKRALFLAHRRELIEQTADKLLRFGVTPGIIMGGERSNPRRQVQVASVQALVNRLDTLEPFDLLFIDEAHHVTDSNQYHRVLNHWPKAVTIGLTATPWRLDGEGLADVFDGHVLATTPRELRDAGFLVPVGGWQYAPVDTSSVKVSKGDFDAKGLEAVSMSAKLFGEIITEWKVHAGGARTVLFACSIRHSQALAEAFRRAGVAAEHLDGTTPPAERAAILARIKSGATRVLCNVNVATEGWDCPELECVILARPTLSTALFLQMVGRILRPHPGKVLARIHDHARCLATHGHPYASRDYSPEKTAKASRRDSEGGVSRVLKCDKCGSATPRWPCEACSYVPPASEVEHQLAAQRVAIVDTNTPGWQLAVGKEEKRRAQELLWKMKSNIGKRALYQSLEAKYGPKRAAVIYRSMSGDSEWPQYEWRATPNMEANR